MVGVVHGVGVDGEPWLTQFDLDSIWAKSISPVQNSDWLINRIVEVELDHVCVQI